MVFPPNKFRNPAIKIDSRILFVSRYVFDLGETVRVSLPLDNSDGKIANLKVFTVAPFSNMTPLGNGVSFLTA